MRELLFILSVKNQGAQAERNFKKSFGALKKKKNCPRTNLENKDIIRTRIQTMIYQV